MKPSKNNATRKQARAGFTMTELLVASSISTLVAAGVMTVFLWCGRQASLCAKIGWSQQQAMNTSGKLTAYMRNAA